MPEAVKRGGCTGSIAHGWAPVGAMQFDFTLAPGCGTDFILGLGYIENLQGEKFTAPGVINKTRADAMRQRYDTNAQFDVALRCSAPLLG